MGEPARIEIQPWDQERSMKPMLGALVQEAVKLALIDSVNVPFENDEERAEHGYQTESSAREEHGEDWPAFVAKDRPANDEERARWQADIFAIPEEAIARMDPLALAQNVACRLLGTGGWEVGGIYGGNASPQDLLNATFARPDQRHVEDFAFDLKRMMEGAEPPEEPDD